MNEIDWKYLANRADALFMRPQPTYAWAEILEGAAVHGVAGRVHAMRAVSGNTVRGLHKLDKDASNVDAIASHFVAQQHAMLHSLANLETRMQYDAFCDELRAGLAAALSHVKPEMLVSYNRIRKLVDLVMEHLVAMAEEIKPALRARLVPWLYLPLDSQMLGNEVLFDTAIVQRIAGQARPGYGQIRQRSDYVTLQTALDARCQILSDQIGQPMHPIYFDLLWRDRLHATGGILFEVNMTGNQEGVDDVTAIIQPISQPKPVSISRQPTTTKHRPDVNAHEKRLAWIEQLQAWRPQLVTAELVDYMSNTLLDNLVRALGTGNSYGPRLSAGVDLALSLPNDRLQEQIRLLLEDRKRHDGAVASVRMPESPAGRRALLIALWTCRPVGCDRNGRFKVDSKNVYGDPHYRPPKA